MSFKNVILSNRFNLLIVKYSIRNNFNNHTIVTVIRVERSFIADTCEAVLMQSSLPSLQKTPYTRRHVFIITLLRLDVIQKDH